MAAAGILDILATKRSAVKLAADAAITVLRVDTVRSLDSFLWICVATACVNSHLAMVLRVAIILGLIALHRLSWQSPQEARRNNKIEICVRSSTL